ncbi:MAG TPA: hypothetical protein VIK78_09870 [Ruminiclostridium sp.]
MGKIHDKVPLFELVFQITEAAFGKPEPNYEQAKRKVQKPYCIPMVI